jgi:hypothetical protein
LGNFPRCNSHSCQYSLNELKETGVGRATGVAEYRYKSKLQRLL